MTIERYILSAGLMMCFQSGCEQNPTVDTGDSFATAVDFDVSSKAASAVYGFPQGMNCGLSYSSNYESPTTVVNGVCKGASTYGGTSSSGFIIDLNVGDWGLKSGYGFAAQYYAKNDSGVKSTTSSSLVLPKGTACGFKHSKNTPSTTCMGFKPESGSCPAGWDPKKAKDSSTGYYFHWCEYQDPNGLCPTKTSTGCLSSLPQGLVCGISHTNNTGKDVGYCGVYATSTGCPTDMQSFGNYDRGASAGSGIQWCAVP